MELSHPDSSAALTNGDTVPLSGPSSIGQVPGTANSQFLLKRNPLQSTFRYVLWTWVLLLISVGWVIFAVYYAYNCTSATPVSLLLFSNSKHTILLLSILSHGTVILLGALTSNVFEATRWTLASSTCGVASETFIGLGRGTTYIGLLSLFPSGSLSIRKDTYWYWGFQRWTQFTLLKVF